jgi:hypothetical protein
VKNIKRATIDIYEGRHMLTKRMHALAEKLYIMGTLYPKIKTLYLRKCDYTEMCDDLRRYNSSKFHTHIETFTLKIGRRIVKGVKLE